MPKTSLMRFGGTDYEVPSCVNAIEEYCIRCAEKDITVDLHAPKVRHFRDFINGLHCFEKTYYDETVPVDPAEFYFTRSIPERKNKAKRSSNNYFKMVRRSLGLNPIDFCFMYDSYGHTSIMSHLKFLVGKRTSNLCHFSQVSLSKDPNRTRVTGMNLARRSEPFLSLTKTSGLSGSVPFEQAGMVQYMYLIASSNFFIGTDSLFTQVAINLGIPTFVVTAEDRSCGLKQDVPHVTYGASCHVSPSKIEEIAQVWDSTHLVG